MNPQKETRISAGPVRFNTMSYRLVSALNPPLISEIFRIFYLNGQRAGTSDSKTLTRTRVFQTIGIYDRIDVFQIYPRFRRAAFEYRFLVLRQRYR